MTDRFSARRVQLRRQRWFKLGVGIVGLLAVCALVWLVWFSSVLTVRSVKVEGETTMEAAQVRDAAAVPTGEQLARLDTGAIEKRVRELPRVRDVEVSRSWPRSVTIEITERTAVVWMSIDGEIHGIDKDGVDYRTYDKEPENLLEANVTTLAPEARKDTIEAVAEVAHLLRVEKPAWADQITGISGGTKDSVTIGLTDGRTLVWGSPDQADRKFEVLRSLLTIEASGYDVSAPDQPTTRD